jgi:type I restriction enzyme S subunit
MMEEVKEGWRKVKLGEVATEIRETYEPNSLEHLRYIGLEHIEQQTLKLNAIGVSSTTQSTKKIFKPNDILFGSLRPYFRKVIKPKYSGVCSTDITVIRAKKNWHQDFLFYFIANQDFIDFATNYSIGTRMPRANWKVLSKSEWLFPPIEFQRKIAAILSAYDDLIENNTRRIQILEEMAQTFYKEWFVKFRFPGHEKVKMVDSELGMIPEGWGVKRLEDVCNIVMGQSPKSEFYNDTGDGLPFHQGVTNFGDRFPIDRMYCTVQNRIAEAGDILFSVRAPVGRINIADKKIVIGRGLCAIRSRSGNQAFVFQQLKEQFKEEDTMGSGTIFKSVTKDDMYGLKILVPPETLLNGFEEIIAPIFAELKNLIVRNVNLRHTRDLLLPKLISSEVDIESIDISTRSYSA